MGSVEYSVSTVVGSVSLPGCCCVVIIDGDEDEVSGHCGPSHGTVGGVLLVVVEFHSGDSFVLSVVTWSPDVVDEVLMDVTVPIQSSVESESSFKAFSGHSEPTHGTVGSVLLVLVDNTELSTVFGQVSRQLLLCIN